MADRGLQQGTGLDAADHDCPACGAREWAAERVPPRLVIRTCARCGLPISEIDGGDSVSYADFDDDVYDAALGRVRQMQVTQILRFARRHATNGTWLDVGCGTGHLLEAAGGAGFRVRGIEPDSSAASRARERVGVDAIREGLFVEREAPPVEVLSTLDVLEHIPVDAMPQFARAVRESLNPGGIWVIKVPSTEGLYFRLAHAVGLRSSIERLWQVGYASPHMVYFAGDTLRRFLERHGFRVVASQYLREMPVRSAFARLTMRGTPRWQAALAVPLVAAINAVERLRRRSDALVVIARPSETLRARE